MNFGPSDGVQPVKLDTSVRFSSIGGLKEHIKCLREMIIFPLMYPELFKKFNTRPAKGILFHGPPGTGKTLLARALANECSLVGGRRVSFFMRKGADVMDKYYGESEKNLRNLFQAARKMKPSIIFFDEIDALAPARRPTNDNTHASLVATLLAEMDGVCDRGDIVIIGATNRPDAMDPAIRRAGRFDRELYFPPPEFEDRRDILDIYTRHWDPSLSKQTLDSIAKMTVGYLGTDIKALCSEAVLKAVRRVYPQIYESDCKLLINAQNVEVTADDMLSAMEGMVPTGARYAPQAARPLPPHTIPLLEGQLEAASELMNRTFPARGNRRKKAKQELGSAPSVFLVSGECAETLIAPALLAQLEHCLVKELSVATLHASHVYSPEHAVISLFSECRRSGRPCVIYIRDLAAVYNILAGKNGAEVLLQLWRVGADGENTLLLATCRNTYSMLPRALQDVFPVYKDCIYRIRKPTDNEVACFLTPVVIELPVVPPVVYKKVTPPPLPRAPTGPLENEQDVIDRLFREYDNLRVLRCSLKTISRNLMSDRRFHQFASPADAEILPDYFSIIKHPMDLATMTYKIDNKQYYCAKDFLDDIDVIATNALLYDKAKPNQTDKKFRQEACALHIAAYAMVYDEIPAPLELECQLIGKRRREKGDDHDESALSDFSDDLYWSKLDSRLPSISDSNLGMYKNCISNRSRKRRRPLPSKKTSASKRARTSFYGKRKERGVEIKDKKENVVTFSAVTAVNAKKENTEEVKMKEVEAKTAPQINPPDGKITTSHNEQNKCTDGVDPVFPQDLPPDEPKDEEVPKVIINTEELDAILRNNVRSLCSIGLEALIDLHSQLSRTVDDYLHKSDRSHLPRELQTIVSRYVRHAKK